MIVSGVCPSTSWGDVNTVCYKYLSVGKVTWAEAERLCHAEEGVLPIFKLEETSIWGDFQEWR